MTALRAFRPRPGPEMQDDLEELAAAAAQGDAKAVEILLQRHLPGLLAFVRLRAGRELRQHESSVDLVQSVCREVLENIDRFQYPSEAAFRQWLYTTALRKISHRLAYWRTQKRAGGREVGLSALSSNADEERLLACYQSFSTPSRKAIVREELERIEKAFEKLPEDHREVITLAHVVGLSRAEIALQMGRSEGAVRVLLHRALAHVAELLDSPAD